MAIVRDVSPSMSQCELTFRARDPVDIDRARAQHAEYVSALEALGCEIHALPSDDTMPDSVFVEDTAVVVDEVAIVARPGAESRQPEVPAVREALAGYRTLAEITSPGTLDGGDVLVAGRRAIVGRSERTNEEGIRQLRRAMDAFGYQTQTVSVTGCLHLKSAVTALSNDLLLVDPRWVSRDQLAAFELLEIDPREEGAANIARVGSGLLYAAAFPRTRERIERRGFAVSTVANDECAKAEGAITCCSLIFMAT
jgi:dimethylargininase